jgi:hypothetical protein
VLSSPTPRAEILVYCRDAQKLVDLGTGRLIEGSQQVATIRSNHFPSLSHSLFTFLLALAGAFYEL